MVGAVLQHARAGRRRTLQALRACLQLPSVSSQPRHAADVRGCAEWLARYVEHLGLRHVRLLPGDHHPYVYADWLHAPAAPTLLIYGHYDVQPVEPRDWKSPPFEPTLNGAFLRARGASDDKGQFFAHLAALQAYFRATRHLPVNVKVLLDGEEEIGSPSLLRLAGSHGRQLLAADVAVISDSRMLGRTRPAMTYALRGNLAYDLKVRGPNRDLHAGSFGGFVHNPLQVLCEILASLHDASRRVAIPGFYDDVVCLSAAERAELARDGPRDPALIREAGVSHDWGEPGFSAYERTTARPALTLNGIAGGAARTIIPGTAQAYLSFRLVPRQEPAHIDRMFQQQLQRLAPPSVQLELRRRVSVPPVVLDRCHVVSHAATRAFRRVFGRPPVWLRSGGTIPAAGFLQRDLGTPTVLMGFGLPGDGAHAPNEQLHLPTFFRAIDTCVLFYRELAASLPQASRETPTDDHRRPLSRW
jgi:acetylornithine deacetylase/succinyl-diaminopimelate desuccinylase-like protein